MYSALDIAKYIITFCHKKGAPVSNLQLQKILYFLWVDFFDRTQKRLFVDKIYAWQLGPVIPDVYYKFNHHVSNPIKNEYTIESIDGKDKQIISDIIEDYVGVSAFELVERSHTFGGAWDTVYNSGLGNHDVIPFELIESTECR